MKLVNRIYSSNQFWTKLYADNKYDLMWKDKEAEKQFLREYAAMVASGISKRSAQSLVNLHNAEKTGGLTYDVLLSDAFP